MISGQTEATIRKLYNQQNNYRPNEVISQQLADTSIVIVVGASCVGKSTAMEAAATLSSEFGVAGNFVTRVPRSDDNVRYSYYEQSDVGLAPLLNRIANHEVVQYAVNPFALSIYGTEIKDYPFDYNLKDVWSTAVPSFWSIGFKQSHTVTIISQPAVWLERFNQRFPEGSESRTARIQEAIQSFKWSLAQNDSDHHWVENINGQPEIAGQSIIDITLYSGHGDVDTRHLCLESLAVAEKLI